MENVSLCKGVSLCTWRRGKKKSSDASRVERRGLRCARAPTFDPSVLARLPTCAFLAWQELVFRAEISFGVTIRQVGQEKAQTSDSDPLLK